MILFFAKLSSFNLLYSVSLFVYCVTKLHTTNIPSHLPPYLSTSSLPFWVFVGSFYQVHFSEARSFVWASVMSAWEEKDPRVNGIASSIRVVPNFPKPGAPSSTRDLSVISTKFDFIVTFCSCLIVFSRVSPWNTSRCSWILLSVMNNLFTGSYIFLVGNCMYLKWHVYSWMCVLGSCIILLVF